MSLSAVRQASGKEPPAALGSSQADLRVVAFKIAGQEYAIDVGKVQEIIRPTGLAHVDGAPEYVEGVVKRRGRIVPIIDLRKRLGLTVSPPGVETCAIVVNLSVGPVGFLVDSASTLMRVKTHDVETPSPVLSSANGKLHGAYFQGIAYLDGRSLVMLDLEQLLTVGEQHELSQIGPSQPSPTRFGREGDSKGGKLETLHLASSEMEAGVQQRADADVRRLLVFELSGELYSVPATDVAEIREPLTLTPMPNVPPHVLGLVNLRGTILPVIDLRHKFGFAPGPGRPDNRLIILKGPNYSVALLADSVRGLARLPRAEFQAAPPGVAHIAPEYYDQVAVVDGRMLIELNIRALLADAHERAASPDKACPRPAEGGRQV